MKNQAIDHRTDADFGPLFSGELLRDEGIAKVSEHNGNWMELCISQAKMFATLRFGQNTFTGEDLRHHLETAVGCPAHMNGWGALINALLKKKIIRPTGEYRKMRDETSHARKTPVYVKV